MSICDRFSAIQRSTARSSSRCGTGGFVQARVVLGVIEWPTARSLRTQCMMPFALIRRLGPGVRSLTLEKLGKATWLSTRSRAKRGQPVIKMRFGIQFYPLPAVPRTVVYARRAMSQHRFERLWVPDHLTHENPFVTLAAILAATRAQCGDVGDQPGVPDAGGPRLQFQRP